MKLGIRNRKTPFLMYASLFFEAIRDEVHRLRSREGLVEVDST